VVADGREWKYFGLVNACPSSRDPTTTPFCLIRVPRASCEKATAEMPVTTSG
jgi:hypothetical protein